LAAGLGLVRSRFQATARPSIPCSMLIALRIVAAPTPSSASSAANCSSVKGVI
jgi:hypothetical protein